MKKTLTLIILIIAFIFMYKNAESQEIETDVKFRTNAIYGNVGIFPIYGTAILNYERNLNQNTFNRNISSLLKFGFGEYLAWAVGGEIVLAQYGLMFFPANHHLEVGIGATYYINGDMGDLFFPAVNVGYRFQKPGGHLIFRTGISIPEAAHLGIGFAF